MSKELWQLYSEDGQPIGGRGATRGEIFGDGLLHAASHVWIWRRSKDNIEVLVQKRATAKKTWPGLLDISAAGHIDLGETPEQAAIRETEEEIGLDITPKQLQPITVHRAHLVSPNGSIENEFQFLYLLELPDDFDFILEVSEVASLQWKMLEEFTDEVTNHLDRYVPHSKEYFAAVLQALQKVAG
jgi:isopentenyl-diphosphate delta-isomerase